MCFLGPDSSSFFDFLRISGNPLPGSGRAKTKNPPREGGGFERRGAGTAPAGYFCHVRFLWRWAFKRLRRLCLFILRRRFFFRLPMEKRWWEEVGVGRRITAEERPCYSEGWL